MSWSEISDKLQENMPYGEFVDSHKHIIHIKHKVIINLAGQLCLITERVDNVYKGCMELFINTCKEKSLLGITSGTSYGKTKRIARILCLESLDNKVRIILNRGVSDHHKFVYSSDSDYDQNSDDVEF